MKLSRLFNNLPKRLFAGTLLALAAFLPVATSAASTVAIEGSMGVANVTNGDTLYAHNVNASYNQVVKLQVYYHNRELPDSGKIAQNLRVKIAIPSTAGTAQTQTATISADNSNTVTSSTTVKLDRADASLQFIPGSAVWRHNVGTNDNIKEVDTKISDAVVNSGTGVVLENEKPCFNFSATVTVLARVMVPGTKVVKEVEKANESNKWSQNNTANPGDTLKYRITYQNTGNTQAQNVIVRDNLPPSMVLVPNTTHVFSSIANGALDTTNNITGGGLNVGNPAPGAIIYVTFEVKVPDASKLACGETAFRNIGIAHPKTENEFFNVAVTNVNKVCQNVPVFSCDAFHVIANNNTRTVTVDKFTVTAKNGATFKNAVISWGDQSADLTTNNVVGQTHQFADNGPFTLTATAHFTVNGKDVSDSGSCTQTVSFPATPTTPSVTPPTELPNTGAGNVIGLVAGVSVLSAIGYRLFLSRKLARR